MFSSSRHLYQRYHDVVVSDTTYYTNRYKMPCGIFSGVNNHLQTIPFAGCLLHDEKRETFDWVFRAFLKAGGVPPGSILTDQDQWMTEAIVFVFPATHITQKFGKWFGNILGSKMEVFCKDFYTAADVESESSFEEAWTVLVSKYQLQDNNRIQNEEEKTGVNSTPLLRTRRWAGVNSRVLWEKEVDWSQLQCTWEEGCTGVNSSPFL